MRRMEKVTGRSDDMVILRGVNLFPSQIEELILRVPGLSPHFQLVLARPQRLDELTVRVESRPDAAAAEQRDPSAQGFGRIEETAGRAVGCQGMKKEGAESAAAGKDGKEL